MLCCRFCPKPGLAYRKRIGKCVQYVREMEGIL